jgi:hypothetical protein
MAGFGFQKLKVFRNVQTSRQAKTNLAHQHLWRFSFGCAPKNFGSFADEPLLSADFVRETPY